MMLSEIYKNRIKELAGIEILSETDQKDIIINKIGLSPELADWAIGLNEKLSIWIANQVKNFDLNKTSESDFRDILDWVNGNQGAINIKKYDFDSAKKEAKKWHDENFKVNNDLVLKDKKIIAQTGPYYWVQLKTVEDCIEEGEAMGHCIGQPQHSEKIASGKNTAFSMRDKNNKPHITIEIDSQKNIIEFKGKQNKIPNEEYMKFGSEFLIQKKELWKKITDFTFWEGLRENYNDKQIFDFFVKKFQDFDYDTILNLLEVADDHDKMAIDIITYMHNNNPIYLDSDFLEVFFQQAKDYNLIALTILSYQIENKFVFTKNMVSLICSYAIYLDEVAFKIIDYIIQNEDSLNDEIIYYLMHYCKQKDKMAIKIINYLNDNSWIFSEYTIGNLLDYVKDKDQIKNLLSQYVSKQRINDVIKINKIDTELIPESHSIHDFRKTIRKLIKENYK